MNIGMCSEVRRHLKWSWGCSLIHPRVAAVSQKLPTFTMSFALAGVSGGGSSLPALPAGSCPRPQPSPGCPVPPHTFVPTPGPPPGAASQGLMGVTPLSPQAPPWRPETRTLTSRRWPDCAPGVRLPLLLGH